MLYISYFHVENTALTLADYVFCEIGSAKIVDNPRRPNTLKSHNIGSSYWGKLTAFSHKTYVPASEASRNAAGPS